jgi:Flp pilus assembly protein TadB
MLYLRPLASSPPADATFVRQIETDLAKHLQAGMHTRATGHVLVAVLMALLLAGTQAAAALWTWLAGTVLLVVAGLGWLRGLCRERARPADAAARLRAFR